MKRMTILSLALLFSTIFNYSSGMSTSEPVVTNEPAPITTLVVNANVTVMLVNNEWATPEVAGDDALTKFVTIKRKGDTLEISSLRNRNLKDAGIIYIPASHLRKIRINSEAHVRSLYALKAPKLDVIINGACKVSIVNIGELHLTGTETYSFEETTEVHRLPASMLNQPFD